VCARWPVGSELTQSVQFSTIDICHDLIFHSLFDLQTRAVLMNVRVRCLGFSLRVDLLPFVSGFSIGFVSL
jgi:hypothetical protein